MPSRESENEATPNYDSSVRRGGLSLELADGKEGELDFSGDTLLNQLVKDFSQFRFVRGKKFKFRPPKTIVVGPNEAEADMMLLHEVGHALLKHRSYATDLSRLKMEAAAWEKARELAIHYEIAFREEAAQEELDTYREWLHQKSRCPECGLTRFQSSDGAYHCPRCENFCF